MGGHLQLAGGEIRSLRAAVVEDEVEAAVLVQGDGEVVPAGIHGIGFHGRAGPGAVVQAFPGVQIDVAAPGCGFLEVEVDGVVIVAAPLAGGGGHNAVADDPQFGIAGDFAGSQVSGLIAAIVEDKVEGSGILGGNHQVIPTGVTCAGGDGLAGPDIVVLVAGQGAAVGPDVAVEIAAPALSLQEVDGHGGVVLGDLFLCGGIA